MRLIVEDLDLSTGGPLIVVLHGEDAKKLDIYALDRVRVKKGKKEVVAIVNISESKDVVISEKSVSPGEIGMFEEVIDKLGAKDGEKVEVLFEGLPKSIVYIKKKLKGYTLEEGEINTIIKDIVEDRLSDIEKTYFVSAAHIYGLKDKEVIFLSKSIVKHGGQLKFNKKVICDKHCIGGLPANRTTMIVVPIIAAAGYTIPKTSTRSITSPAGTSDTMEVLTNVGLSLKKIKEVVKKTNGCMIWGGALGLASADDKIIKIERPVSLDTEGIMISSVLAKKLAVGSTHVLIDIPMGETAKVKDIKKARRLKKRFERVGRKLGMYVKVIITDGSQPIGNGIGPTLEARDVMNVLKGNGPYDLREKALRMAGILLEMVGEKRGYKKAKKILDSGKAYEKMLEIINAQGKKEIDASLAKFDQRIIAKKSGVVSKINNKTIASVAKIAGAPRDKKAGVDLRVKLKDKVKKGDTLFVIYSENQDKLNYALELSDKVITLK